MCGQRARRRVRRGSAAGSALLLGLLAATTVAGGVAVSGPAQAHVPDGHRSLYLVTLTGPGTAGRHDAPRHAPDASRAAQVLRQDALLDQVGASAPVYRWTTALDGFAVRLDAGQAATLAASADVALVERDAVRRLTGLDLRAAAGTPTHSVPGGGRDQVIGFVDSGLWPHSAAFAESPGMHRRPPGFHGPCRTGPGWRAGMCDGKVVAARFFVRGFGADRIASSARLSPVDDDGHGTLSASIAAGDGGVTVQVPGVPHRLTSGVAPRARVAVYKACWQAPDPANDGCSTADLVTAVDRATADGVDVLDLPVSGPDRIDTVERALLGATEAGTVVVASAGNGPGHAAHPSPWVTTVGAGTGEQSRGAVEIAGGPRLTGAMSSRRHVGPVRVVLGSDLAVPGRSSRAAARCLPGSLDAGRTAGRVVVCRRGGIGRVDKSAAVARADGVGMVLVNTGPGSVDADLHSVPTVHLDARAGSTLTAWVRSHPRARIRLVPSGTARPGPRVPGWSRGGDRTGPLLKPDLLAPGLGVLGAVPPDERGLRWDLESGTSAATAAVSGLAAALGAAPGWTPGQVRSALATTARPVPGAGPLRQGAGLAAARPAARPHLAYLPRPGDYRRWLDGLLPADALDATSVFVSTGATSPTVVTRQVTNVGERARYFSSTATGFRRHQVVVTPAAARLAPGESLTFHLEVYGAGPGAAQPLDSGAVTWTAEDGTRVRIPVVIAP
ncbi:S8 family serine peptidase [Nocardioides cynanchi]|uniref:S8 family serine peptidase n=1 Tax=Nocardioides cynanchi TaxID=2558918 RepID=UPI001780EBF8|nr:S8 family serine peptidase [Nocardioides cynanchi]